MSASVGADVESLCSVCGDVWHIVVAKLGDSIVKVQCKQCNRVHRPKPVPGSEAAKAAARKRTPKEARAIRTVRPVTGHARHTTKGPSEFVLDPSKPFRPYSPAYMFEPGEQIKHNTFGPGVVEEVPAPGKVRVLFADSARTLVQAREGGGLAPPPQRIAVAAPDDEEA
jgi:hypothetical protein